MTGGVDKRPDRRTILRAGVALSTALAAGCSGNSDDAPATDGGGDGSGGTPTEDGSDGTPTEDGSDGTPEGETDGPESTGTVIFEDDFEDGDYTSDPAWELLVNPEDGEEASGAEVVERSSPEGSMGFQLTDRTNSRVPSSTDLRSTEAISGVEGSWTLSGLFSPVEIPDGVDERRNTVTFYWPPDANFGNRAVVEFSVSRVAGGDPELRLRTQPQENREWTTATTTAPALETDQWYRWVLSHDGEGSYVGRRWRADGTPEDGQTVQSSFEPPGESVSFDVELLSGVNPESRSRSFQPGERPYTVDHDHVRWVLD